MFDADSEGDVGVVSVSSTSSSAIMGVGVGSFKISVESVGTSTMQASSVYLI